VELAGQKTSNSQSKANISVIFKEKLIETCLDHCKEGNGELLKNMIS